MAWEMSCSAILIPLLLAGVVLNKVTAEPGSLSAEKMCSAGSAIKEDFKSVNARLSSLSRDVEKFSTKDSQEDVAALEEKMAAMKAQFQAQLDTATKTLAATRKKLDSVETKVKERSKTTADGSLSGRLLKLENAMQEIVRNLKTDECTSNPCSRQSTCEDKYEGYDCRCKDQWYGEQCEKLCSPAKDDCLMLMDSARNWTDARAQCQKLEGELTILSSHVKYELAFTLIKERRPDARKVYVGAYRGNNQEMVWLDGSAIDPQLWQPGQPNNYQKVQDCGDILWADSRNNHYLLNDDACDFAAPFICDVS